MVDNFKILKQCNNKLETASNEQIFVKKLQYPFAWNFQLAVQFSFVIVQCM